MDRRQKISFGVILFVLGVMAGLLVLLLTIAAIVL